MPVVRSQVSPDPACFVRCARLVRYCFSQLPIARRVEHRHNDNTLIENKQKINYRKKAF